MKFLSNEKGNTLLIILLMVVIFTTIGLSLLGTTLSGMKKTDVREADIQSTELAEKGIDYLTTLIQTKTPAYSGLPVNDFNIGLNDILKNYLVPKADSAFLSTSELPAEKGSLKVKVYYPDLPGPINEEIISKVLTLHSEATVNGETKRITSTIHLGAKAVPDALKYALGAYNPCKGKDNCETQDDDGNVFLHGGVAIKGDLYVEGNLITKNKGVALSGSQSNWIDSDLPSVEGESGNKAHLILGKEMYKMNNNPSYYTHIAEKTFPAQSGYEKYNKNNVSSLFTQFTEPNKQYVPIVDTRTPNFLPIDIEAQRTRYYFTDPWNKFTVSSPSDPNFNNKSHQEHTRIINQNKNIYVAANMPLHIDGSHAFNRLSTRKYTSSELSTFNSSNGTSKISFKEGAYINGNLHIGRDPRFSYDASQFEKFEIDGPIFVDGDLTIWGSDVKFNSTVYVTGKTTIRYAKISGIQQGNSLSTLVLFGKKTISIANINLYEDTPNLVRGFFYTEDVLEMFGVGSNIKIEGGIFGRKVVLNALKGISKNYWWGNYYEAYQTFLSPSKSRLQVQYNSELIENPPEGLPKVRDLNIDVIERKLQ
ncbi:hypothetical protein ACFFJY_03630 [Fictibacillus aquaticus]|uniref:Type 4 fimbrial biogenesis protein PilX N-terminal domain-containing protein n=1 Tax=Fictibacillus aquaticus TaxID=2021314 RepID=A0A235FFM3_9BACL|nr:hypothetical protein [Fictibacillus aquaticus]OYD59737.1 hypothetical protein CGZ90_07610 [Fictibacillus aquaticus]